MSSQPSNRYPNWAYLAALLGAVGVGAWLRVRGYHQSLFGDEYYALLEVGETNSLVTALDNVRNGLEVSPPLYFALAWATKQVGNSFEALRVPSIVFGSLLVPTTYFLGRRVAGRNAGLLAAWLAALSPFLIFYSAEARPYAMVAFFGALVPLLALRVAARATGAAWIAFTLACAGAIYTHYTTVFAVGACILWLFIALPSRRKQLLASCVGAVLLYLPWASSLSGKDSLHMYGHVWSRVGWWLATSLAHVTVGAPYITIKQVPGTVAAAIALTAVVVGAATQLRKRVTPDQPIVLAVLVVATTASGLVVYSLLTNVNLLGVRNFSAAVACIAVLVACAVAHARPAPLAIGLTALTLAVAITGTVKATAPELQRPDGAGAAAFVDEFARANTLVSKSRYQGYMKRALGTYSPKAPQSNRPVAVITLDKASGIAAQPKPLRPAGEYMLVCSRQFGGFIPVQVSIYDRPANRRLYPDRCRASTPAPIQQAKDKRTSVVLGWANGTSILSQDNSVSAFDIVIGVLIALAWLLFGAWSWRYLRRTT